MRDKQCGVCAASPEGCNISDSLICYPARHDRDATNAPDAKGFPKQKKKKNQSCTKLSLAIILSMTDQPAKRLRNGQDTVAHDFACHPNVLQQSQQFDVFLRSICATISSDATSHRPRPPKKVLLRHALEQEGEQLLSWLQHVERALLAAGVGDVLSDVAPADRLMSDVHRLWHGGAVTIIIVFTSHHDAKRIVASSNSIDTALKDDMETKIIQVLCVWQGSASVPVPLAHSWIQDARLYSECELQAPQTFEDLMTGLNPLGVIPIILGCNSGAEKARYTPLLLRYQLTFLPPANLGFCGRENVLQALYKQLAAANHVADRHRLTLSGLPGIGKTQTALAFAYKFQNEYVFCRWLNADAHVIENELEQLAHALKIAVVGVDITTWRSRMYQKLQEIDKWLLVFDNVESREFILPFLPEVNLQQAGQHILMTSRNPVFKGVMDLDSLESADVEDMLRVNLRGCSASTFTHDEAVLLGERLGNLPLALAQATAYMRVHGSNIASYLEQLNKIPTDHEVALLDEHGGDDLVVYPKSVRSTLTLAMEKIANESLDAVKMLDSCAWMHADDIPLVWFEQKSLLRNSAIADKAREVLRKYSMISSGNGVNTIKIHRLVQEVVLIGQSHEKKKEMFTQQQTTLNILLADEQLLVVKDNIFMARALVPHMQRMIYVSQRWLPQERVPVTNIMMRLAFVHQHLGQPQRQKELAEQALEILEGYYGSNEIQIAPALGSLANAYGLLGNPNQKKDMLERALNIRKQHNDNEINISLTLVDLSNAYGDLGQPAQQMEKLQQALKIQEKHCEPNSIVFATTLANLGNAYGALGQPAQQKDCLNRALKVQKDCYGPESNHFEIAINLHNLSMAYGSLGDPNEQKNLLEQAWKVKEKYYGPTHFEVAATLNALGVTYGELGNPTEQKRFSQRALEIMEEYYETKHLEIASILNNLGNACVSLGQPDEGKERLKRALSIKEKFFGLCNPKVVATKTNLANAFGSLGRYTRQKELLEEVWEIEKKHNLDSTLTQYHLARPCINLGFLTEARLHLDQALKLQRERFGPHNVVVGRTLVRLAELELASHQPAVAESLSKEGMDILEDFYKAENFNYAIGATVYAEALIALARPLEAVPLLHKALGVLQAHFGDDNFETVRALLILGFAEHHLGKTQTAIEMLEKALRICISFYGLCHFETSAVREKIALAGLDVDIAKALKLEGQFVGLWKCIHFPNCTVTLCVCRSISIQAFCVKLKLIT